MGCLWSLSEICDGDCNTLGEMKRLKNFKDVDFQHVWKRCLNLEKWSEPNHRADDDYVPELLSNWNCKRLTDYVNILCELRYDGKIWKLLLII